MRKLWRNNNNALLVLLANILLLACAAALYGRYTNIYQERLMEENLGNIANLNRSAAMNATAMISSWDVKLDDITQFVTRRGLDYDQTLEMICDDNSSSDRQFQLVGSDYKGYAARRDDSGGFVPVSYTHTAYDELQRIFDGRAEAAGSDIRFAPEFTDSATALKYFAIYNYLPIADENGETTVYTLMLATRARDVLAAFNTQNVFDGLSSVLIDSKGNYIVSSADFKSDNFFQYLYVYNDLTLDEKSGLLREMTERGSGEMYYKDSMGLDCVYRYAKMDTNDWYCITSVPLSSFHTPAAAMNYAVYAVALLILMLIIDVVWQRDINRRLKASVLREKEAGNAKTEFLSRMSHDIRTPLNGIIGMTTLALDENNPPQTREYLSNIKTSGDFLLGLVNDILDMSKVESGKMELRPEPYSCPEFCSYIKAVIEPLCRDKGLSFRMTPPDNELCLMFDRLRVNQIFFNLLSNSVKYTPTGGNVELMWEATLLPGNRAAVDFIVRDDGIGMSEDFQARMFESFSQEHASGVIPGSGLGLSIVWNLVNLMGGNIRVLSREGEGTTVFLHLETDVCRMQSKPVLPPGDVSLSGKRVLLCEDNRVNAIIIQKLMEKWNVGIDVAENGKIGLDMYVSSAPDTYDAVLMDVQMPEMNGLEATRELRRLSRPDAACVPIIALTANAYDSDVKSCLDAGMNEHMGKPIQPERLREALIKYTC